MGDERVHRWRYHLPACRNVGYSQTPSQRACATYWRTQSRERESHALRENLEEQVGKSSYYEAQYNQLFDSAESEVPRLRYEVVAANTEIETLRAKAAQVF